VPSALLGPDALLLHVQEKEVSLNYIRLLLALKKAKVNINAEEKSFGWTSLHFLANAGRAEALEFLLEAKADTKKSCKQNNTALHLAARSGHVAVVESLLAKDVQLGDKNLHGFTALSLSAMNGHKKVLSSLVSATADINSCDGDGLTASMWAAKHGFGGIVYDLLSAKADIHLRDLDGLTFIDHAHDRLTLWSTLVESEKRDGRLLDAARRNDAKSVLHELEAGAHVNAADEMGCTTLQWAFAHSSRGSTDLAQLLIEHDQVARWQGGVQLSECGVRGLSIKQPRASFVSSTEDLLQMHDEISRADREKILKQKKTYSDDSRIRTYFRGDSAVNFTPSKDLSSDFSEPFAEPVPMLACFT